MDTFERGAMHFDDGDQAGAIRAETVDPEDPTNSRGGLAEGDLAAVEARAALEVALAEIAGAAFLVRAPSRVVAYNAAGHAWLAEDPDARATALGAAASALDIGPGIARVRAKVVPVPGAPKLALVVLQSSQPLGQACLRATQRWGLSIREGQVLALLTEGLTNRAIAAQLGVSPRTIEFHLRSMFEKAQVETRAEVIARLHTI